MVRWLCLAVLCGCASMIPPEGLADDINRTLGYKAVSFDRHCMGDPFKDPRTECFSLVWRDLPKGMVALTLPPRASYLPWEIALSEAYRDNLTALRSALAHELGHVLGLPDEEADGRA